MYKHVLYASVGSDERKNKERYYMASRAEVTMDGRSLGRDSRPETLGVCEGGCAEQMSLADLGQQRIGLRRESADL